MKRKILAVALAVALLAILVSGTLAYFTAEDRVDNTFTVGSVAIDIWENGTATTEAVRSLGQLLPVVNKDAPSTDPSYFSKVVKVKNTGLNSAYIRTHIAVPTALLDYLQLDLTTTGWTFNGTFAGSSTATVGGVAYTVFTYDHTAAVDPGEFTAELLQGVYLKSEVDIQDNPATDSPDLEFCKPNGSGGYTFSGFVAHSKTDTGYTSKTVNILVASEAIQSKGFGNAAAALNSGFGTNTNPWQN